MVFAGHRRNDRKLDIKSVRIILLAMCAGVLILSGIAFGIASARPGPIDEPNLNMLLLVLAGLAASQPIAFFAVRTGVMRSLMNVAPANGTTSEATDERARQSFLTLRIIAAAMAEGTGFFAAIICLSTGSLLPLAVVLPVVMIVLLQFPTDAQMRRFLSECARKHVR